MPAPQYRKHIAELLEANVEVIDIYPFFCQWKESHGNKDLLYSKDHHISPIGAKLIADIISDYLKATTADLKAKMKVYQDEVVFCDWSARGNNPSKIYMNYTEKENVKELFWHQGEEDSRIAVFGDCNLQSYAYVGGGILANLAYNLQYPVYDAGRVLVFDDKRERDNEMSKQKLDELKLADIKIYVAFSSAGFVRTSQGFSQNTVINRMTNKKGLTAIYLRELYKRIVQKKQVFENYKWANFDLI